MEINYTQNKEKIQVYKSRINCRITAINKREEGLYFWSIHQKQKNMKRKLLLAFIALLSYQQLYTQNFNNVRLYLNGLENKIQKDTSLMSGQGLNIFMAKKVNTYLTGSGDLSINKNYFIIDPTDGRLFLGHNWAKDPSKDTFRTKWIFTSGIKSNVAEAFSTIYSGKDQNLSKNTGLSLKLTLLGRGIVNYGKKGTQIQTKELKKFGLNDTTKNSYQQQEVASYYREQLKNEINDLIFIDSTKFENKIKNVGTKAFQALKRKEFYTQKSKLYKKMFIEEESKYIDEEEIYNSFWNHWVSLDVYLPVTRQKYQVSENFIASIEDKLLYNFEGTLLWSNIYERKSIRLLATIGLGAKMMNNITTTQLEKYTISSYKQFGGTDTLSLAQIKTDDIYIGDYEQFFTPLLKFNVVNFFLANKQIGLSLSAEKHFGVYNPLNIKAGIPFNLKGKDDDTKVSFELQFKWNDFHNNILPDIKRSDKFMIGLSVGIPLTSQLY